jgi:hypothetical protein
MSAVLPHYKQGPASLQVSTLIYGGQLVMPTTLTAGTTDFTVKVGTAASVNILGVAGADGNVLAAQAWGVNTYGQPQGDISVLPDYIPVYYSGYDILVWYSNAALVLPGGKLIAGATGSVTAAGAGPASDQVVGICTQPGGVTVAMCNQQIGGQGAATFFLGRARLSF